MAQFGDGGQEDLFTESSVGRATTGLGFQLGAGVSATQQADSRCSNFEYPKPITRKCDHVFWYNERNRSTGNVTQGTRPSEP